MKTLLSTDTIHDVLVAITLGDRETVDKYMLKVQDHFTEFAHLSDEALKPLVPLLVAMQEHSHTHFTLLLMVTCMRLLVLAVQAHHPICEKLILLRYDEVTVQWVYDNLVQVENAYALLKHFSTSVFHSPAELAKKHRMKNARKAICKAAIYLDLPFHIYPCHPLTYGAERNDPVVIDAYFTATDRNGKLHFDRPEDGYSVLIDVLKANNYGLMKRCLEEGACADVYLPTGISLLDAAGAYGLDMQMLLLQYGGKSTDPAIKALHKAVNSMTDTVVEAECFEAVLDNYRVFRHTWKNGSTPFSQEQSIDLFKTAARLQNETALRHLLPHFAKEADTVMIDGLIDALFHTEDDMYVDIMPAERTIGLLQLFNEYLRYHDPIAPLRLCSSQLDEEYELRITSNLFWILHECGYERHYTQEQCKTVATLLWKIGGGTHEPRHMKELFAYAVSARNEALIRHCLQYTDYSVLDTDYTTALWRVFTAHQKAPREECEKALRFAIAHGANIHHKTAGGTSTLDAIRTRGYAAPDYAADLFKSLVQED